VSCEPISQCFGVRIPCSEDRTSLPSLMTTGSTLNASMPGIRTMSYGRRPPPSGVEGKPFAPRTSYLICIGASTTDCNCVAARSCRAPPARLLDRLHTCSRRGHPRSKKVTTALCGPMSEKCRASGRGQRPLAALGAITTHVRCALIVRPKWCQRSYFVAPRTLIDGDGSKAAIPRCRSTSACQDPPSSA
jgi:hypothetical protein